MYVSRMYFLEICVALLGAVFSGDGAVTLPLGFGGLSLGFGGPSLGFGGPVSYNDFFSFSLGFMA